jgi:hypothetical protein
MVQISTISLASFGLENVALIDKRPCFLIDKWHHYANYIGYYRPWWRGGIAHFGVKHNSLRPQVVPKEQDHVGNRLGANGCVKSH